MSLNSYIYLFWKLLLHSSWAVSQIGIIDIAKQDDILFVCKFIQLSPHNATCVRQWVGLALVQMVACRLFSATPLFEPILGYRRLDHREQTSVKFVLM